MKSRTFMDEEGCIGESILLLNHWNSPAQLLLYGGGVNHQGNTRSE